MASSEGYIQAKPSLFHLKLFHDNKVFLFPDENFFKRFNIFQVFHSITDIVALTVRSRKKVLGLGLGKESIFGL